ncbi:MAG: SprT family zinc-dependent metalloprotease [Campylobacterota bacterium]|nr:SprT family zinc-dependent metalloprotease [Campylobacterota bacterium]
MSQQIILDDHKFLVNHRTNKKIKRISLQLESKDEILLKTPLGVKSHMIKEIIFSHKEWILKTIHRVPTKNKFDFVTGGIVPFLGKEYPMKIEQNNKIKKVKFSFLGDSFLVEHHEDISSYEEFVEGVKIFYKHQAIKIIDPIFDEWTFKTKLFPNKIGYRFAKTRWGSCSYENNISINYKLLQFDKRAIEYVVLHELCHIEEKNHSKRFWNLVSLYMPDYKEVEKNIKDRFF